MKFLDYIKGCKSALVISSRPLDFDCIGSGLILKKYLESLKLKVDLMFPSEMKTEEKKFNNFLPYFDEIKGEDTREVLKKQNYDLLILVDGSNLVQFYDATKSIDNPPNLLTYKKRVHIDHHQNPEPLGELTYSDKNAAATTEIILSEIIPIEFIDQNLATLGYAAILGDTGNFSWGFGPKALDLAGKLLDKGARAEEIIYRVDSKSKLYFEMFKYTLSNIIFDDKLKTVFMFLPVQKLQEDQIDEEKLDNIKQVFTKEFSKSLPDYPRSFLVYEREKDLISITSRGNNFINKINLPQLLALLGGNSGGHFNASGARIEGNFEEIKNKLLTELKTKI